MPCQHGQQRSQCKECGASNLCQHRRIRSTCKERGNCVGHKHCRSLTNDAVSRPDDQQATAGRDPEFRRKQPTATRFPIGTEFCKQFDSGVYEGIVSTYDPTTGWYLVQYDDGDQEELSAAELIKLTNTTSIAAPGKSSAADSPPNTSCKHTRRASGWMQYPGSIVMLQRYCARAVQSAQSLLPCADVSSTLVDQTNPIALPSEAQRHLGSSQRQKVNTVSSAARHLSVRSKERDEQSVQSTCSCCSGNCWTNENAEIRSQPSACCDSFRVQKVVGKGRGLFYAGLMPIPNGKIILVMHPVVAAL